LTRPASCSSRCTLTAVNTGTARRTASSNHNWKLLAHRPPQTSAPPGRQRLVASSAAVRPHPGGRWHAACA
jgi:hypothetical protein